MYVFFYKIIDCYTSRFVTDSQLKVRLHTHIIYSIGEFLVQPSAQILWKMWHVATALVRTDLVEADLLQLLYQEVTRRRELTPNQPTSVSGCVSWPPFLENSFFNISWQYVHPYVCLPVTPWFNTVQYSETILLNAELSTGLCVTNQSGWQVSLTLIISPGAVLQWFKKDS